MPNYRRAYQPGGTFFLTLVTHGRANLFDSPIARRVLRESVALTRRDRPFELVAAVLLPDHVHLIVTLPTGDSDFSNRIAAIKGRFSRRWLGTGGAETPQSVSRARQEYRGIWQKRFWEHVVRDVDDLNGCFDYVHCNPVKHRVATCPHAWPWSTFHRFVRDGRYAADWCCGCQDRGAVRQPLDIDGAEGD